MVTVTCPWCEQDEALSFADVTGLETAFTCPACGSTVALTEEEPSTLLDLAA